MDIGESKSMFLQKHIQLSCKQKSSTLTEESTSDDVWFFVFESYINWVNALGSFNMAPKQ